MGNISVERWIKSQIRRMSGIKLQSVIFFVACIVIWLIFGRLSDIKELQEKNILISYKNVHPANTIVHQPVNPVGKLKYRLSAKNPEGVHLQHVRNVFSNVGYERWHETSDSWDIMWSYEYPFQSVIKPSQLQPNQLVNHFPGSGFLTSKVYLATSKFKYIPTAFNLPQEKDAFIEYANSHKDKLWVQKSNDHRGIKIKSISELDLTASHSFVQEFVSDPFLVDGRKFDIGLYTIITSVDPLRVYVYNGDWLLRYCTLDYYPLDVYNPKKYVVGDDYTPTWEMTSLRDLYKRLHFSHKNALFDYIKKKGHDVVKFEKEIYEAVADMAHEKQQDIVKAVSKYPYGTNSFFEMVRFDFVIDTNLNIYLMEVNMSPNLSSAHFEDNRILYEQVVYNTLSLIGATNSINRNEVVQKNLVTDRDIQVYDDECQSCVSCDSDICKLCSPCHTNPIKQMLKLSYMEHLNQHQTVRVYPKLIQADSTLKHSKLPDKDKLLHLWYNGMCRKEQQWCV